MKEQNTRKFMYGMKKRDYDYFGNNVNRFYGSHHTTKVGGRSYPSIFDPRSLTLKNWFLLQNF